MISTQGPKLVILELNFSDVKYDRMTSCHECRERLKPPVVLLPCNHNLCQVCCQKIFDNKSLPIKNSRNGGRRIRCPACRYEVVLDMHGVHSLPRTKFKKIILPYCQFYRRNVFCIPSHVKTIIKTYMHLIKQIFDLKSWITYEFSVINDFDT